MYLTGFGLLVSLAASLGLSLSSTAGFAGSALQGLSCLVVFGFRLGFYDVLSHSFGARYREPPSMNEKSSPTSPMPITPG